MLPRLLWSYLLKTSKKYLPKDMGCKIWRCYFNEPWQEPTPCLFSIYLEIIFRNNWKLLCKNPEKRWLFTNFWEICWFPSKANFNILAVWHEGISNICYYKCWSFLYSKLSTPNWHVFISFQFHRRSRKGSESLCIFFLLPNLFSPWK